MSAPGGPVLKVDPKVLRSTGRRFERVGEELAELHPDAPLSDVASGVAQLATGPACARALENIATQMKSLADGARTYGQNMESAAQQYQSTDQSSAGAMGEANSASTQSAMAGARFPGAPEDGPTWASSPFSRNRLDR